MKLTTYVTMAKSFVENGCKTIFISENHLRWIFYKTSIGAIHLKIVFPFFSRLTGKKYYFLAVIDDVFLRLGEICFGRLLGGKNFAENHYSERVTQISRKMAQFRCIWTNQGLILSFPVCGSSASTRDSKKEVWFHCVFFTKT